MGTIGQVGYVAKTKPNAGDLHQKEAGAANSPLASEEQMPTMNTVSFADAADVSILGSGAAHRGS